MEINLDEISEESKQFLKVQEKDTQEILDTIKVSHILIIRREEIKKKYQVNGRELIANKIIEGNYPQTKEHISIQIQKVHRTQTRQDQKKNQ